MIDPKRDRLVITASSLGTVFEWYDFFVYGTLAALIGKLFFPSENPTAALLLSLATFGAGFGVRPVGAVLFGYLGDMIGRKYTFLVTITLMGGATAAVGLLPTHAQAGIWAPAMLVVLRLLQGLALGGEYGGAAIYVAEHAPKGKRGFYTSFIQASVIGGFLLSIIVVLVTSTLLGEEAFHAWGWRIPFLFSIFLLGISLWIRLMLKESPIFQAMKAAGQTSKNPLVDSFRDKSNVRMVLVALFGVAAGLTVIWYTAQFQALYFLKQTARLAENDANLLVGLAAAVSSLFFIFFGWLSDHVGRKKLIILGYALTLLLLFPVFHTIARAANPALAEAMERAPVTIMNAECGYDPFAKVQPTDCGKTLDHFSKQGIGYTKTDGTGPLQVQIGDVIVTGYQPALFDSALAMAGYPGALNEKTGQWAMVADPAGQNSAMIVLAICVIGFLSGMTYGPVAALLVELFPAKVRYTSMSVPYHIGTGYFGGFLPFVSQYIVAKSGDVFGGLWYTFAVVALALVVSIFFLPETKDRDIGHSEG